MSELRPNKQNERPQHLSSLEERYTPTSIKGVSDAIPMHQHTMAVGSDGTVKPVHSLSTQTPRWLRPFLSLHVQLASVFSLVLLLVLLVATMLSRDPQTTNALLYPTLVLLALGGIGLTFTFTILLLRPLVRITDATQAIALGDLKQRDRLPPLHLPPQDEIDRLSGSIDEMVTRLERAEELQHAAEDRFRRFFSDASHQLRTPLTSIRGFTEVLLRGAKDDPDTAQRVLKLMSNEAERMTALINNLLTLARLNEHQPLKMQYIDLLELVHENMEQARTQASDDRSFQVTLRAEAPFGIQANKERVKQLLFILLDNAVKHGLAAPQGSITIILDKREQFIEIHVSDNGPGIPQDELDNIFDSFYHGRHQRTPGAGLGLAIASAIVEAHQGRISVHSVKGEGTDFVVALPCTQ
ncbi:sensor histidine kinase [Ktedonospora formicarum]|uniref:histidine kinase n=1 Tax=Ktedonospora formicarum TaxID=2778364 RepID=A0A8J3I3B0_9CHLR|nr:HAMP domain-containing sensor histidine kinase [Ktedonospora formicarum]GHO44079.1 hypothetical protein KSX_22420 [Ktedonospora formicarum]